MKKLLSCIAILLSCYTMEAQTLSVNNSSRGDVYLRVYAVPGSCSPLIIDYVDVVVAAFSSGAINLALGSNWNSGSAPAGSYELSYAYVSRDPSCPGSIGWGTYAGLYNGVDMFRDEVVVGDGACGYSGQYCIENNFTPVFCSGYQAGDVVYVSFTTFSLNVNINIFP